jgi:hypothetical protein
MEVPRHSRPSYAPGCLPILERLGNGGERVLVQAMLTEPAKRRVPLRA